MATVDNIFVKTMKLIKKVFFSQMVLCIAILAMLVSCIFVPIDSEYAGYFNFQTLATLFCTLAVVGAFSDIHLFEIISKSIIIKLKNLRYAVITLVFITFFGSMILANDMALLTFLPLGFFVLDRTDNYDSMAFTFIMQNIAANLGGMLTPFGNPQNLYLFAFYEIDNIEFMKIMFPTFAAATVMIIIICLFVKKTPLELKRDDNYKFNVKRTVIYSCLFVFSILIVFRVVNPFVGTFVVVAALMFLDRKALKIVNYPLLLTFCCFFVFSSNLARIQAVNDFFRAVLPKNTLLFGIISCQFISNVPSAVLLSHFTDNYRALLQAVNIGGCGTLIASLASLITFTEFKKHNSDKTGNYLAKFTAFNVLFIVVLYFVATIFM